MLMMKAQMEFEKFFIWKNFILYSTILVGGTS